MTGPCTAPYSSSTNEEARTTSSRLGNSVRVERASVDVEPLMPAPTAEPHCQVALSRVDLHICYGHKRMLLNSSETSLVDLFTANQTATTSVIISLPAIERGPHIGEMQLQWLISGYPLSSVRLFFPGGSSGLQWRCQSNADLNYFPGCLLLGRFADLHGRKKTFIGGSLWLRACTGSPGSNPFLSAIESRLWLKGTQCNLRPSRPQSLTT